MKRIRPFHVLLLFFVVLAGCKVDLYTNLEEKQANEMLALLISHGIETDKAPGKENTWAIMVDKSDIGRAVLLLEDAGYPKRKFDTIDAMFQKQGLVSSPLEERARYIYAISQGLSKTLQNVDGVLIADTHVVLPERNPLDETVKPSSASIFIKYRPDVDIAMVVPEIKKLVMNSVEGLTYEKITVGLFPAEIKEAPEGIGPIFVKSLGIKVAPSSVGLFHVLIGILVALVIITGAMAGFCFWRFDVVGECRKLMPSRPKSEGGGGKTVEVGQPEPVKP